MLNTKLSNGRVEPASGADNPARTEEKIKTAERRFYVAKCANLAKLRGLSARARNMNRETARRRYDPAPLR